MKVSLILHNSNPITWIRQTFHHLFFWFLECNQPNQIKCRSTLGEYCISEVFKNDGIVNCPPPHCTDEGDHCPNRKSSIDATTITIGTRSNKTDIALSAITSLIFTICGVGTCLWFCWKIKECFIDDLDSNRQSTSGNGGRRSSANRANAASSPTLELPTSSSDNMRHNYHRPNAPNYEEKNDLPPPYESLFPNANNN